MRADPSEDSQVLTDWLGEWLSDGRSLLLMTDYDGTLTPHVPNPSEASLVQRAQRHLSALARAPQVRVAIISGRDLGDVSARVGVPGAGHPERGRSPQDLPRHEGHRDPAAGRLEQRALRSADPRVGAPGSDAAHALPLYGRRLDG